MQLNQSVVMKVLLVLQLLMLTGVHGIPSYCNQIIRPQSSARSQYQETKTSLIVPRCPLNGLAWKQPRFKHILVFFKRDQSFRLCVTVHSPRVTIFRLKGASKQPIIRSSVSGSLGCVESECKHVTFSVEPDQGTQMKKIKFTYTYNKILKTPKCTEVCQQACLCRSQYVFIGSLKHTIHDQHTGFYRLYFKILNFIRYNDTYVGNTNTFYQYMCGNRSHILHNTDPFPSLSQSLVPAEGTMKVYSKTPLTAAEGDKYLVAGSLRLVSGIRGMMLCCVDEDETYAVHFLRDIIYRQCCA